MNKMFEIGAYDDGYGDNKSKCQTGEVFITPSFVTTWRPQYDTELDTTNKSPLDRIELYVGDNKYLVGKAALQQDKRIQWNGADNKHLDTNFDVLLKTHLGLMSQSFKSDIVRLVMGLPVKSSLDLKRIEVLKDKARGQHKFSIKLLGDTSPRDKTLYVEDVVVKAQPHGTLADMVLDDMGRLSDKDLAKKTIAISDIGGKTHNMYVVEQLDPLADYCDTTNNGMYTAYTWIKDWINEKWPDIRLSDGQMSSVITRKEVRGYDISPLITKSYEQLARNIILELKTRWDGAFSYIDEVVFTGGGAEVLKPYLMREFMRAKYYDQSKNVNGMLKQGIRDWVLKVS